MQKIFHVCLNVIDIKFNALTIEQYRLILYNAIVPLRNNNIETHFMFSKILYHFTVLKIIF